MTFPEIFENFKNHSYIRRESWDEDVFIQLRNTVKLIRKVVFKLCENNDFQSEIIYESYRKMNRLPKKIVMLNDDIKLSAEDLIADDWIDIDDLMPKPSKEPKTLWEYVDTLEDGSDKWRIAIDLGSKYHKAGKNPDEYLEEIIKKVEKN